MYRIVSSSIFPPNFPVIYASPSSTTRLHREEEYSIEEEEDEEEEETPVTESDSDEKEGANQTTSRYFRTWW